MILPKVLLSVLLMTRCSSISTRHISSEEEMLKQILWGKFFKIMLSLTTAV